MFQARPETRWRDSVRLWHKNKFIRKIRSWGRVRRQRSSEVQAPGKPARLLGLPINGICLSYAGQAALLARPEEM
jgi:hypothetical protein